MRKIKPGALANSLKKYLSDQNVKPSEYEAEFVKATCDVITDVFNKSYDTASKAVEAVENTFERVWDTVHHEEKPTQPAAGKKSTPKKAVKKKAVKKKAAKKKTAKKKTTRRR